MYSYLTHGQVWHADRNITSFLASSHVGGSSAGTLSRRGAVSGQTRRLCECPRASDEHPPSNSAQRKVWGIQMSDSAVVLALHANWDQLEPKRTQPSALDELQNKHAWRQIARVQPAGRMALSRLTSPICRMRKQCTVTANRQAEHELVSLAFPQVSACWEATPPPALLTMSHGYAWVAQFQRLRLD